MIKILFFAALRERLQCAEQQLKLSSTPMTIAAVLKQLQTTDSQWQQALSQADLLCALNQQLVSMTTQVNAGDELAFFPPVTGG
ncbi:molybdopterin converting factor subunit 1 [Rheinheimera salexigens]|uniref:Molybdopterin synthase sulfur carrier subunit n=1 Tax=Rheinheimera salexigens TaxID=1628148 RepID=A0A1E7Q7M7_9GAMM|nr:molybdopterin converting factor subunit 1 [Rheinheimera salexigens]OEY70185.1 molybdopterin converting factor subunit 1 [Rheinheimera salexigens]